jgi:hypothetical protein
MHRRADAPGNASGAVEQARNGGSFSAPAAGGQVGVGVVFAALAMSRSSPDELTWAHNNRFALNK